MYLLLPSKSMLFDQGPAKQVVVLAQVHQGFRDDKMVKEH